MENAIAINNLDFAYAPRDTGHGGPTAEGRAGDDRNDAVLFQRFSLEIPVGARCLLLGQNGVGKTTLLRILGGKHMVPAEAAKVLGASAFHQTDLVTRVAFLGGPFPFDVDLSVREILAERLHTRLWSSAPEARSVRMLRRDRLMDLLGIDPAWRMTRLSSGQRRRVQIMLGLLDPVELVLLDEVTADLDVLSRADLLGFLREESAARGTTILYATHVLDGLERWATHLCFLSPGCKGTWVRVMARLGEVPELSQPPQAGAQSPLLALCERWLREDRQRAGDRPFDRAGLLAESP